MPVKRRTTRSAAESSGSGPVFGSAADTIVPGEVLLTLSPGAADSITASVPVLPAGPALSMVRELGVDELDGVLADVGAYDITRLALPAPRGMAAMVRGLETVDDQPLTRSFRVRIAANADVAAAAKKLQAVASVEVAEPNRWRESYMLPNDTRYGEQWGLPKINAPSAWDRTTGAASVVVAVIDSGVDLTHPDLVSVLVPGYDMVDLGPAPVPQPGWRFEGDFSGRDASPDDEVGHGTHVSATIAAMSNNAQGVAGVTWNCRIMPVKALTRMVRISDGRVTGVGSSADIAAAIRYAADNGASVINMSLGSSASTSVEASAVAYAIGKGVVVVAAMGNDGTSNPSFPAAYPDVISVGASDSADHRASFSQTGPHIDVVAPGVDILSAVPVSMGSYGMKSGTSMATPHVAGVAALVRSVKPSATVAEVADAIRSTARALRTNPTDPVPNDDFGAGLVDAAAAVNHVAPPLPPKTLIGPGCGFIPRTPVLPCIPFTPKCPPSLFRPACPITIRFRDCVPLTPFCPPRSLVCTPTGITPATPTTTLVQPTTPATPTLVTAPPTRAGGAGFDPYGYFGATEAVGQPAEDPGADDGFGQAYQAGFEAGYQAGLEAAAGAMAQPEGADSGAEDLGDTLKPFPWPRSLFYWCPPKTIADWSCLKTVLQPQCLPVPTPPWKTIITPTTPVQGPIFQPAGADATAEDLSDGLRPNHWLNSVFIACQPKSVFTWCPPKTVFEWSCTRTIFQRECIPVPTPPWKTIVTPTTPVQGPIFQPAGEAEADPVDSGAAGDQFLPFPWPQTTLPWQCQPHSIFTLCQPETLLVRDCLPNTVFVQNCAPRTVFQPQCIRTVVDPRCFQVTPTWRTLNTTTPQLGTPAQGPIVNPMDDGGSDPYGTTPFQG